MHIKQNKTDRADLVHKTPDHVALIFAQGENVAEPCKGNKQDELGIFPKNIIEIARQFGVRYLTFCCLGSADAKDQPKLGSNLKILFHLLLVEKDWLKSLSSCRSSFLFTRAPTRWLRSLVWVIFSTRVRKWKVSR